MVLNAPNGSFDLAELSRRVRGGGFVVSDLSLRGSIDKLSVDGSLRPDVGFDLPEQVMGLRVVGIAAGPVIKQPNGSFGVAVLL